MVEDDALGAYIRRISALSRERSERLDAADLQAIALEMGLTEADLAAAAAAARDHLARGEGHARHGLWNDAIAELEAAVVLAPGDLEALHQLARAHLARWQAAGSAADRAIAERLARRCLTLDPHHEPSFTLLAELDAAGPRRTNRAILALAAVMALSGAAAFWLVRAPAPEGPESVLTDTWQVTSTADIPVALGPVPSGLRLETGRSRLENYRKVSYYTLEARLINAGTQPIRGLALQAELRDRDGAALATLPVEAIPPARPLRPGEARALEVRLKTTDRLHDVRLVAPPGPARSRRGGIVTVR